MPELKPFDVSTWFGVFLPANTPKPIVDSLNAQMKAWLADPRTLERIKTMAGFPSSTPSSTCGSRNGRASSTGKA